MSPLILVSFVLVYFLFLLVVAYYTSRNSNNESFFIGNRNSNWMLVAFGMIGTSLSRGNFCYRARNCWRCRFCIFPGGDWLPDRVYGYCLCTYFLCITGLTLPPFIITCSSALVWYLIKPVHCFLLSHEHWVLQQDYTS